MNFCASESISSLSLSLMAELPPSRCLVVDTTQMSYMQKRDKATEHSLEVSRSTC